MFQVVTSAARFAIGFPLAVLGGAVYFAYWAFAVGWCAAAQALGEPD